MVEQKKLALFDIDGVVRAGHLISDIVQDQEKNGLIPAGTWEKIYFEMKEYGLGSKSYQTAADNLLAICAEALKGVSRTLLVDRCYEVMNRTREAEFAYFSRLLPSLKINHIVFFVTANLDFVTEAFGRLTGVDRYLSSVAETKDGKLTGKIKFSLAGNKGQVLQLLTEYGRAGSIAVGNSENDIDMLNKVDYPFVFEPNEKLKTTIHNFGWRVIDRNNAYEALLPLCVKS